MHNLIRPAVFAAALAIVAPSMALAKPATSPFNGTWKLNTAASKFGSHPQATETRVYDVKGNKVTLTSTGTDMAGKPTAYHYSATYDGKWYPMIGNPIGDSISLKLVNPRTIAATVKKGSAVTSNATVVVSGDGKHLTLTRHYPGGRLAADVSVFDKQ
jgi:hypothetical protein